MAYTIQQIIDAIEAIAPKDLAEDYDNVGLMTGGLSGQINTVGIAVDATPDIAKAAQAKGCNLLITHHPLIFPNINKILPDSALYTLVKHNIDCYCAHTNFDNTHMARYAALKLGLNIEGAIIPVGNIKEEGFGCGAYGGLSDVFTLKDMAALVKSAFLLKSVLYYGEPESIIKKTAIIPGSGMSMVKDVINVGAQVLITGDIKHHQALDALEMGLMLIDAGHFGIEKIFIEYMADYLKKEFHGIEIVSFLERQEAIIGAA